MAQWGFEGACLHWELGEQTCLAEKSPSHGSTKGSPIFALSLVPWALWGGWDHDTGSCPPLVHTAAMHSPHLCSSEVSKPSCDTAEHGVREGDREAKVGLNHCPGLNRAKFGLF